MRYSVPFVLALLLGFSPLQAQQARLQVIHNASDPAAAVVDLYVNGSLFADDFAFRTATAFGDVPAGVQLSIGVAPGGSTSANDILTTFDVTLEEGKTYIAFANGVLDPSAFAENPEMRSIAFTLFTTDMGRESGGSAFEVDLKVLHGATDAPAVDVIARGVGTLVDDAAYGDMTDYFSVPAASYVLDVTLADDNMMVVASYAADLSGLGGGAAVVFASGFLVPEINQDGPAFGLFAALPDGTVIPLPLEGVPGARLQVIHNAADPAATLVDIYVNDDLLLDDFGFRTATPFVDVPAGVDLEIGVAPSTSSSAQDALATFTVNLSAGMSYIAMASGMLDPSAFARNPDDRSTAFRLFIREDAREAATSSNVDLTVFHGATDAPTVDVVARGVGTLVEDAAYGDFSDYLTVPTGSYTLDITPGDINSTVVASFTADLTGLGGGAAAVFASGFLSPMDNGNGPAFGLFAALADGTVLNLASVTSVERSAAPLPVNALGIYPNPARNQSTLNFSLRRESSVELRAYDMTGREVLRQNRGQLAPGTYDAVFNTSFLSPGLYRLVISTGDAAASTTLSVVR